MKHILTAKDLYGEILKGFYFGVCQKGDHLMTYRQLHELYGFSKNMIGAAYEMLRRDGFIRTDGANGTISTFDFNNPQHVDKVPLECSPNRSTNSASFEIAIRLHANALYEGLIRCNEALLEESKNLAREIAKGIQGNGCSYEQVFGLWMDIVSTVDNIFLYRITDRFMNQYMYFMPPDRLSPEQTSILRNCALEFYQYLMDALERRDFGEFPERFWQFYNIAYQEGGIVFAKLENGAGFREQALYGKMLDNLCVIIMAGGLKKGDSLPTTARLCAEYGVSRTTVNRAYGILLQMGIIKRRARSGTQLFVEPADLKISEILEKTAESRLGDWRDAVNILMMMNNVLNRYFTIPTEVMAVMRLELTEQRLLLDRLSAPFPVSVILISPLIESLPTGILQKYYSYVMESISQTMALCKLHIQGNRAYCEEVYQLTLEALCALEQGDQALFAVRAGDAMRRNVELIEKIVNEN